MKGLFIPEITAEMFRNGCLESIDALMADGEIYDIDYPLEQEPCEDCISRAETMTEIMMFAGNAKLNEEDIYIKVSDAVQLLRELPPVTPQSQTGHWIRVDKDKLRCSECEVIHLIAQYPNGKINWCPNCGAKMESEE